MKKTKTIIGKIAHYFVFAMGIFFIFTIIFSYLDIYTNFYLSSLLPSNKKRDKEYYASLTTPTPAPYVSEEDDEKTEAEKKKIILKYYSLINDHQLEKAYQMYSNPKISLNEFKGWYSDLEWIEAYVISQSAKASYRVDVSLKEKNKYPEYYQTTMTIKDGLIETSTSENITPPSVVSGNMTVYTMERNGINYLILSQDDQETVIDKADSDYYKIGYSSRFYPKRFSPKGTYFEYGKSGYESYANIAYNLKTKQHFRDYSAGEWTAFSADEQYFISCRRAGFFGAGMFVYKLDDASKYVELSGDFECQYDADKGIINVKDYYTNSETKKEDYTSRQFSLNNTGLWEIKK